MATSTSTGFPCQKIQLIWHNTTNNNNYYMMMRNSAPSLLPMPTAITTVGSISPTSLISRVLISRANCHKNKWMTVKAANSKSTETSSSDKQQREGEQEYEEYEVVLEKPYGLKFVKGRDGGTYIDAIAPGLSADKTGMFTVGDKVLATSAVFGDDVWSAAGYGQTMYAIRQRVGPLYMKMQKRYGIIMCTLCVCARVRVHVCECFFIGSFLVQRRHLFELDDVHREDGLWGRPYGKGDYQG